MDARVLVVGSYVQDHAWLTDAFPQPGETRRASGFHTGPGGKGFNQAIACHRQGVPTAFVGAIGRDHLGKLAEEFARKEGIDCQWLRLQDQPTAASSIVVDSTGENCIVVNLAANERLDPQHVKDAIRAARHVETVLLQLETNLDAVDAAITTATDAGMHLVMNPAPAHPDIDQAMLRRVELITPNETELALLVGRSSGKRIDASSLAESDDATLHALCRALGVATVVVTLGRHGCFVSHDDAGSRRGDDQACYRLPAAEVNAIDSTGAGDAFSGALVAAMLHFTGQAFRHAVEHANRAAGMATEKIGTATAMVDFESVRTRFGS